MISHQHNVWQVARPQKTVTNFIRQGMHTFWKNIRGETQLYSWKHIWVTVIHISDAKAKSVHWEPAPPGTPGRAGMSWKWNGPPDKSLPQPGLRTPDVWEQV